MMVMVSNCITFLGPITAAIIVVVITVGLKENRKYKILNYNPPFLSITPTLPPSRQTS
jgi:hypothetical protein